MNRQDVVQTIQAIRYRGRTTKFRFPLVWLRHRLSVRPNDAFLASYPRSGNTWARFLLCEVLTNEEAGFTSVASTIPTLRLRPYGKIPSILPSGGRLLRTHERYHKEYKKAVYFVRDPRDVIISNYEFERGDEHFALDSFDDFVAAFVRGKVNSFGNWSKHVKGWLDSPLADSNDFLLVKYEEMRRDTERVLSNIVKFLGVAVDCETIRKTVANNDLHSMRVKEDRYHRKPADGAGRQVRVGSVGGWQQRLSAVQVDLIEHHAGDLIERLGYTRQREFESPLREAVPATGAELLGSDLAS
jgi:hypothetical protein